MTMGILERLELVKHLAPVLLLGVPYETQRLKSMDAEGCDVTDGDGLQTSIPGLGRVTEALVLCPVAHHPGTELVLLENFRVILAGPDLDAGDASRSVLSLVLHEFLVVAIPRRCILELSFDIGFLGIGNAQSLRGGQTGDLLVDTGKRLPGGSTRCCCVVAPGNAGLVLGLIAEQGLLGIAGVTESLGLLLVDLNVVLSGLVDFISGRGGGRTAVSSHEPKRPGLVLDPHVPDESVLIGHAHVRPVLLLLHLLLGRQFAPLTDLLEAGPPGPGREVRALPLDQGNLLGDGLGIEDVDQLNDWLNESKKGRMKLIRSKKVGVSAWAR